MNYQEMLDLPLNETRIHAADNPAQGCWIRRVPDGWIYGEVGDQGDLCCVFVPEPRHD